MEVYQPESSTWEMLTSLNTGRFLHTATELPDGRVLVTGGGYALGSPTFILSSTELLRFKPAEKQELGTINHRNFSFPFFFERLITLTTCVLIITACTVIVTACVVILLGAWLIFFLVQRWRRPPS
ncbi:MAG: hypothetical protein LV479_11705 [Methylacidiphilales bacterium]|nr:hypothetical protein [Candidatus Methylacidiphilales bacterium]